MGKYIGKIKSIKIKSLFASLSNKNKEDKLLLEKGTKKYFIGRFTDIGDFDFNIWTIPDIKAGYEKTNKNIEITISVNDLLPFPEMNPIEDAYIGFIPYKEFLKIIEDENGNFRGSILFYDNPRDFLGYNDVNKDIKGTLERESYDIFPVLNNGITIITEDLKYQRRNLYLKNFQIINGCQTTHILYEFKDKENISSLSIPVKFIATKNEDIKNEIIIATNNQTRIGKEELVALSGFQKLLEEFYNAMNEKVGEKLFYERRKNQYIYKSIPKNRIIDIKTQSKAFASMFLELPHEAAGYYGKLTKRFGKDIFNSTHRPYPYYISALSFFRLMQLFNKKRIDKDFRKMKFHILMIFGKTVFKNLPQLNNRKIDMSCEKVQNIVLDDLKFLEKINDVIEIIKKSGIDYKDKNILPRVDTKNKLLEVIRTNDQP